MKPELFWIPTPSPGRLAMAPRPRGGDWLDEFAEETLTAAGTAGDAPKDHRG
jgi:hypothetical protein